MDTPMNETQNTATGAPDQAAAPVETTSEIAIPQVGDITPRGIIQGVRHFAAGGIEISFNGADFEPA